MKKNITYWEGSNLGEGRKRFMKENLRLEEITAPTEKEISDCIQIGMTKTHIVNKILKLWGIKKDPSIQTVNRDKT